MPYTKSEFGESKQTSYKKAVAVAASTNITYVHIRSIVATSRRTGSIQVLTELQTLETSKKLRSEDDFKTALDGGLLAEGLSASSSFTLVSTSNTCSAEEGEYCLVLASGFGMAFPCAAGFKCEGGGSDPEVCNNGWTSDGIGHSSCSTMTPKLILVVFFGVVGGLCWMSVLANFGDDDEENKEAAGAFVSCCCIFAVVVVALVIVIFTEPAPFTFKDECPAGMYVASRDYEENTAKCVPCPPGTFTESSNLQTCTGCPKGTYSELGSDRCLPSHCRMKDSCTWQDTAQCVSKSNNKEEEIATCSKTSQRQNCQGIDFCEWKHDCRVKVCWELSNADCGKKFDGICEWFEESRCIPKESCEGADCQNCESTEAATNEMCARMDYCEWIQGSVPAYPITELDLAFVLVGLVGELLVFKSIALHLLDWQVCLNAHMFTNVP